MYPNELKDYIDRRNGKLNREGLSMVTNINLHPQLNHIRYNPWDDTYDMWDKEGNHYHFKLKE